MSLKWLRRRMAIKLSMIKPWGVAHIGNLGSRWYQSRSSIM